MRNYFYLQLKRVAKILPFVVIMTLALLIGLAVILFGVLDTFSNSEDNKRFSIAVSGDTENEYLSMGMIALKTLDETRFSVDFIELSEEASKEALERGEISAYIVIPDDFVENAFSGQLEPITLVTSAGMEGVVGLLKRELTTLITDMVVHSQKGTYAIFSAFKDNSLSNANRHVDAIALGYAELIFQRNQLYEVSVVGVSNGLSTTQYYVCAILMLLLVFLGLPFGMVYIKREYTFQRLLVSRGYSSGRQIIFEYLAHLIAMVFQVALIFVAALVALKTLPFFADAEYSIDVISRLVVRILPVIILLSAFNFLVFELSSNIVNGLLMHFFLGLGLCYVSGCMYPLYSFPDVIRSLATFLPTNIARCHLATAFTYAPSVQSILGLMLYSAAFLALAWFVRHRKISRVGGGRYA